MLISEPQQFSLAGIANIELIIYHLEKEHSYLISKNISICTESLDTCEQNYVILENMLLPILQCSNNGGFIKEDFSLERWRNESGFSLNDSLTSVDVSELFEYIGLSYYLLSTRCNRSSDPYIPSIKGWNSLCINNEDLTNLTGSVSCNLDSTCNKISCCVDIENLDRTMEISLSIDHCNSRLTLQLERLSIDVSLVDYKWGTQLEHGLVGVVNTETIIYNLAAENNYMVYLTVLICLESNDTCSVDEVILDGVKFSKGVCDRSMENEFSLDAWLDEKSLPKSTESLPLWAEVQLKQDLNIDKFLKPQSCSHTLASSNDCGSAIIKVVPTDRHDRFSCRLSLDCTSVECCINLPILDTSVSIVFEINECRNNLRLQIDNLKQDLKLSDVLYGQKNIFGLFGIVTLEYILDKDSPETFSLHLDINVCFEPDNCELEIEIFNETTVNRQHCDQAPGFLNSSFSLSSWLSDKSLDMNSIDDATASDLITELGLSDYMGWSNKCSIYAPPFNGSIDGWSNDCSNITTPLVQLNESVACHITEYCDSVTCCAEIPVLKRYVYASVNLRTCDYILDVYLEENHFEFNLMDYEWGKIENVQIHGVLQLVFAIHHIPSEKLFSLDVKIKACFEENGTVCLNEYTVMEDSNLLYSQCDLNVQRAPFKGISFDLWQQTECSSPATSSCSFSVESTSCSATPDCQGITCCLPLTFINGERNINVTFHFISCTLLEYSVERKLWQKTPEKSKVVTENIGDAFQYNYTIATGLNPTTYGVTIDLQVCYLAGEFCKTTSLLKAANVKCSSTTRRKKRRRRSITEPSVSSFKDSIRMLIEQQVSSEGIEKYLLDVKNFELGQIQENLIGAVLPGTDTKTSVKSAMKALGWNNPATIAIATDIDTTGNVTGGEMMTTMMGSSTLDIQGRTKQAYVVGHGLTNAGVKLLGQKLANMTIGDIENLLDVKNVDPVEIIKLMDQLRDLFRALTSEFLGKILGGGSDVFKSEDLVMWGEIPLPRQSKKIEYPKKGPKIIRIGGFINLAYRVGIGLYFGVKFRAGLNILEMKGIAEVVPYAGITAYAEIGLGFGPLFGKLRVEGQIMDMKFPTRAEVTFSKFPLDVGITMNLELTPLKIKVLALVTLELQFLGFSKTIVLYKTTLWSYSTPTIRAKIIDKRKDEKDQTAPAIEEFIDKPGSGRKKRSSAKCLVRQIPYEDYTEPKFEVSIHAGDDRSGVNLYLDIGTIPGGTDVLNKKELAGPATILSEVLKATGVPLYLTVTAENDSGQKSKASCYLSTYDITPPGGRLDEDYKTTSNPSVIKASITVYEDSELVETKVALGYGKDIWGDQVVQWHDVRLDQGNINHVTAESDPLNRQVLGMFTSQRRGKLVGPKVGKDSFQHSPGDCARLCADLPPTKCMSFNYNSGNGMCELVEAIEGHHFKLSHSGYFYHYERLGVGKTKQFNFDQLQVEHDKLVYVNFRIVNDLGYLSFINTQGVLVDLTTPTTGEIKNASQDFLEHVDCLSLIPEEHRPDWVIHCRGMNPYLKNHRLIVDGKGSKAVFNGYEPMTDLQYTRINTYITANWDGFNDRESGLLGYTIYVGMAVCEDLIHPHHDPHKHFFEKSQWPHNAMIYPIPAPYETLPDDKYYITVRALNEVEYGGPLATTVCHSKPLGVDNSPPHVWEIYDIRYDENTYNLTAKHNSSDPHSGLAYNDVCLGRTRRDCIEMDTTFI
ncbi:uncharacterized protein LOC134692405 [Mytilus trossulus]|uniref:uncharacterized protein LOC134692405 n=1 Tax=Mytilus trossulus TaxID=6551 RepID=UPI003005E885